MPKDTPLRRAAPMPRAAVTLFDSQSAARRRGEVLAGPGQTVTTYESKERPGYWGYKVETPPKPVAVAAPASAEASAKADRTGAKKGGE